jgi:hypothetical protein
MCRGALRHRACALDEAGPRPPLDPTGAPIRTVKPLMAGKVGHAIVLTLAAEVGDPAPYERLGPVERQHIGLLGSARRVMWANPMDEVEARHHEKVEHKGESWRLG